MDTKFILVPLKSTSRWSRIFTTVMHRSASPWASPWASLSSLRKRPQGSDRTSLTCDQLFRQLLKCRIGAKLHEEKTLKGSLAEFHVFISWATGHDECPEWFPSSCFRFRPSSYPVEMSSLFTFVLTSCFSPLNMLLNMYFILASKAALSVHTETCHDGLCQPKEDVTGK